MQAFSRIDIQNMCFASGQDWPHHQEMKFYDQDRIDAMPLVFECMRQARSYLELIMQRYLHFSSSLTKDFEALTSIPAVPSDITPEQIAADGERYHSELQRWREAFEPISVLAIIDTEQKDFLAATGLRLQYLASYISIPTQHERLSMRPFMSIFREMIPLARTIITHPHIVSELSRFTFDCQVIVPLYVIALRCPHRLVRREAVTLLLKVPKREGLWDGLLAAQVVSFVIELEEEGGTEDDFAADGGEVRAIDITYDMVNRSARVCCLVPQSGSEDLVKREKIVTW